MQKHTQWQGMPFFPVSQFYKTKFGGKVWKIPVSVAQSCPNREGLKGMKTCNFCDVWGSAAYPEFRELELRNQIIVTREKVKNRHNAEKFLVYLQSYTNTFSKVAHLRRAFEVALEFEDVVGLVVGTRPDCLSDAVFDLWNEYSEKVFLSVEVGVQTFDEEQLIWMRRGHTGEKSLWAIHKIRQKSPQVDLGIHLMLGLPGETDDDIVKEAKRVSQLPIDNVKLHNLHVLKNTELEKEYLRGEFQPIDRDTYARRVMLFLQHLNPRIAVHRLAAVASRHDELVAPEWTADKMASYQYVLDTLKNHNAYQGQSLSEAE